MAAGHLRSRPDPQTDRDHQTNSQTRDEHLTENL
jgi:hypothetical protein